MPTYLTGVLNRHLIRLAARLQTLRERGDYAAADALRDLITADNDLGVTQTPRATTIHIVGTPYYVQTPE